MSSASSLLTVTLTDDFAKFNRGPITSLFQPPTSCLETLTSQSQTGNLFLGHNGGAYFDPACYPEGSGEGTDLGPDNKWDLYYYSPAICPSGWTTGVTITSTFLGTGSGPFTSAISLGTGTSAFVCCPKGFKYSGLGHVCTSVPSLDETITFFYPTQGGKSWVLGTTTTSSVRGTTKVVCDGIPIWWQASDAEMLSAASLITSTLSTSSSAINTQSSATSTASSTMTGTPAGTSDALSTGAKAAIGVSVPLVFLAILAGVFWFFRKRNKRAVDAHQGVVHEPHITVLDKGPNGQHAYELQNNLPVEMYTDDVTYNRPYNRP